MHKITAKLFLQISAFLCSCVFLLNCTRNESNRNTALEPEGENFPIEIPIESIKFMRYKFRDISVDYHDKTVIHDVIEKVKQSTLRLIKFGSFESLTFYDANSQIILSLSFRGDMINIKGKVFQSKETIFTYPEK